MRLVLAGEQEHTAALEGMLSQEAPHGKSSGSSTPKPTPGRATWRNSRFPSSNGAPTRASASSSSGGLQPPVARSAGCRCYQTRLPQPRTAESSSCSSAKGPPAPHSSAPSCGRASATAGNRFRSMGSHWKHTATDSTSGSARTPAHGGRVGRPPPSAPPRSARCSPGDGVAHRTRGRPSRRSLSCSLRRAPPPAGSRCRRPHSEEPEATEGRTDGDIDPEMVSGHEQREPDPDWRDQEQHPERARANDGCEHDTDDQRHAVQARHCRIGPMNISTIELPWFTISTKPAPGTSRAAWSASRRSRRGRSC